MVRFWKFSQEIYVIIDDRLPVDGSGALAMTRPGFPRTFSPPTPTSVPASASMATVYLVPITRFCGVHNFSLPEMPAGCWLSSSREM